MTTTMANAPEGYALVKYIRQSDLTTDCWMVQIWGLRYCSGMEDREPCEFLATEECGGYRIRHAILKGEYPKDGLPNIMVKGRK